MDVCDVSIAELTIAERLADGGYVDPEGSVFYENVRPHVLKELPLCENHAGTIGEQDQDIECPAAEESRYPRAIASFSCSQVQKDRT